MTIKSLILDEETVSILSYASLEEKWFESFQIPSQYNDRIKRVLTSNSVYLLSKKATKESRLLVIKIDNDKLFTGIEEGKKKYVFDRILVIALSKFGSTISPGKGWGKYVSGNKLSIYATQRNASDTKRIFFDTNPLETNNIYAFDLDSEASNLSTCIIDEDEFIGAVTNLDEALCAEWPKTNDNHNNENYGIELTETLCEQYSFNSSLQQWYDNKLTTEQRTFVDKSYDEPVRLKGAAGTGKTLALAVKFLRDAYHFEDKKENKRLLFITHSYSTSQHVLDIIRSMDERGLWENFEHVTLKVTSLYDLAQDILNYNLKHLTPLSTDGNEGRQLQYVIISDVINKKLKDIRFKLVTLEKCSSSFKEQIINEDSRRKFILEVLNEFACILDAENIYLGSESSEKYLSGQRESWQMDLETYEDRKAILELHDEYRKYLRESNVLSMDQMIADLNRYLLSHEWNHLCKNNGFDAIFIDELHCFTKPERMLFHALHRNNNGFTPKKIPLFMAYDVKQSIDDRYLHAIIQENASSLVKSTKVGRTKLVELTKVFRYTPEISEFLSDLDGAFPALDLASEWNRLSLSSDNDSGKKPTLNIFDNDQNLLDAVFNEASRFAKKDKKKTVAILCANSDLFQKYLKVGRINKLYEPLTSRDEIIKLSRLRGKCIFSMPQYVAGLQFDTVYIINLDKNEIDEENPHCGEYRRFVSQVYLGASRAKSTLKISSSLSRRGPSQILQTAITNGSILTV